MNQEIKNLLTVYENKMSSFWQLDGQLSECEDDNRYLKLETRQRVLEQEVNITRAALVAAIERLEKRVSDYSWERNPDRMGGQFTQEEIDRASRGGEGW